MHFSPPNTLLLRDNNPSERNGLSSLNLLSPNGHQRKTSNASSFDDSNDGTEPDSHSIGLATLATPSPTHSHFDSQSVGGTTVAEELSPSRSQSRTRDDKVGGEGDAGKDPEEPEAERPVLDLQQDENIDTGPFKFKPYHLASLVDPKNLPELESMGGVKGLLRGLGSHRKHGLSARAFEHDGRSPMQRSRESLHAGDGRPGKGTVGAGDGSSQRHDRLDTGGEEMPGIVVIDDDGQTNHPELDEAEEEQDDKLDDDDPAYNASIDERHRLYGQNTPHAQDKELAAVNVASAQGQGFGASHPPFTRRVSPVYCAAESSYHVLL